MIDAGISCRQILERIFKLRENPGSIKGIFVTHEHIDHTRGVDVLAREFGIPIYATKGTIKNSQLCSDDSFIQKIKNDETLKIGGMEISAFSKSHDAEDPVSFRIKNGKQISIATDIGYACKNVIESVEDSNFLAIESNHDLSMLENGPYPAFLKKRILGDRGHLSNLHSGLCVLEYAKSKLNNVLLSHISAVNNTPGLALSTFRNLLKERKDLRPKISLSLKYNSTGLFSV